MSSFCFTLKGSEDDLIPNPSPNQEKGVEVLSCLGEDLGEVLMFSDLHFPKKLTQAEKTITV